MHGGCWQWPRARTKAPCAVRCSATWGGLAKHRRLRNRRTRPHGAASLRSTPHRPIFKPGRCSDPEANPVRPADDSLSPMKAHCSSLRHPDVRQHSCAEAGAVSRARQRRVSQKTSANLRLDGSDTWSRRTLAHDDHVVSARTGPASRRRATYDLVPPRDDPGSIGSLQGCAPGRGLLAGHAQSG